MLRIGGLVPFSTVDFPGRLSAVVFCQGCPWRCRYCHNPHLQPRSGAVAGPRWAEVLEFLRDRRGFLDAVVFSGGEPTIQPQLQAAIASVRGLGFQTGLHTAGIVPHTLRAVLPLVDWVGLDIKAPFDGRYAAITQAASAARRAKAALRAVRDSGVAYEIRTTWHPLWLDDQAKRDLNHAVAACGARPTRWQKFRPEGCADPSLRAAA